jgi:predicted permease
LSSLPLSPTREAEIVEELSQHLDDRWRELVSGGAEPGEATRLALEDFQDGNVLARYIGTLRQAQARVSVAAAAPAGHLLGDLAQSLRDAMRTFRKQPGLIALAAFTLALGIGATSAIFSVVHGVLLKPLPFQDPDRLVAVYHKAPVVYPDPKGPHSAASYFTYRDSSRVFEDVGAALWETQSAFAIRNDEPEPVRVLSVTDGFFSVLGVQPAVGRLLNQYDDTPGAPNRVVLTHGYWQQAFGAAPDSIGRSLVIAAPNAVPYEIIGVLPPSFSFRDTDAQVFLPLKLARADANPVGFAFRAIARLRQGVSVAQANDDVARMIPLTIEKFPLPSGVTKADFEGIGLAPNVIPLADDVVGAMRRPLWILLGSVVVVLLMAWTNVANLLLVRAEGRQRELTVRSALGASRGRIAAGLLSESLLLGLTGAGFGVLFAQACLTVLRRLAPAALPRVDDIAIDGAVLLFTLTASITTSLLFGLVPVLKSRIFNVDVLKEAGRSTSDTPGRHRTRSVLVTAQLSLALVLLVVSGLMIRTFVAMRQIEPGYLRPEEVQTFGISLPRSVMPNRQQVLQTYEEIAARLKQVPGVTSVGMAAELIMGGSTPIGPVEVENHAASTMAAPRKQKTIGAGYFETMGNMPLAGRAILPSDIQQRAHVAVVSENFAREFWGEPVNALHKHLRFRREDPWSDVVGVVRNERDDGLNQPALTTVFFPMSPGMPTMNFLVRSTRAGTPPFVRDLQEAVRSVKRVPLADVRTLEDLQAASMAQTSFAMVMLAIAAAISLLLALVGIYGVVSYIVVERTREIGIRMALGAQADDVRALFLRQGLVLATVGVTLGIGASVLLTPLMSALLFGVRPTDPITYVSVGIVLTLVTLLATYVPACRASRVNPIIALRPR